MELALVFLTMFEAYPASLLKATMDLLVSPSKGLRKLPTRIDPARYSHGGVDPFLFSLQSMFQALTAIL